MALETVDHIDDLNENNPDGSVDQKHQGDDHIRNIKKAVKTDIAVDHETAGSLAGQHKQLTLKEKASDPTNIAVTGFIYTKDVSGATELFYEDAAGNVIQFTAGGVLQNATTFQFLSVDDLLVTKGYGLHVLNNISFTAAVAAQVLTFNILDNEGNAADATSQISVSFRSTTLTDTKQAIIHLLAALSLAVPVSATLGFAHIEKRTIQVYLINNAGVLQVGVRAGSQILDENVLHTTVAVGTGADSLDVLYSNGAYSNIAVRFLGYVEIETGAVAGDWDNAPTMQKLMQEDKHFYKKVGNKYPADYYHFGEGSDGAIRHTASGTLTSDIYHCTTFRIDTGVTMTADGTVIIFASERIDILGSINADELGAAFETNGYFGGPGGGGGSFTGWYGTAGGATILTAGGARGIPSSGAGGNGISLTTAQATKRLIASILDANNMTVLPLGGGGGGDGANNTNHGGQGGGLVILVAPIINYVGTFSAVGADGEAYVNADDGGSGGGGGGSIIAAAYVFESWASSVDVAGGLSAASAPGGGNGGNGGDGWELQLTL